MEPPVNSGAPDNQPDLNQVYEWNRSLGQNPLASQRRNTYVGRTYTFWRYYQQGFVAVSQFSKGNYFGFVKTAIKVSPQIANLTGNRMLTEGSIWASQWVDSFDNYIRKGDVTAEYQTRFLYRIKNAAARMIEQAATPIVNRCPPALAAEVDALSEILSYQLVNYAAGQITGSLGKRKREEEPPQETPTTGVPNEDAREKEEEGDVCLDPDLKKARIGD